jgi:hypothetical protein
MLWTWGKRLAVVLLWRSSLVEGWAPGQAKTPVQALSSRAGTWHTTAHRTHRLLKTRHGSRRASSALMAMKKSKQADLLRKLQLAKQQKEPPAAAAAGDEGRTAPKLADKRSDQEIEKGNDRLRFAELLQESTAKAVWNDYASADGYQNHAQVEEEINAQQQGADRLFEGDPAPVDCFADLVQPRTGTTVGEAGHARLIPWLTGHKTAAAATTAASDYLILLCDPRAASDDLRGATRQLWTELPAELRDRLIIINADSPAENRRWFKQEGWSAAATGKEAPVVYTDPGRTWMRTYTALGRTRWSMTLFVVAAGRVQKLVRDVDVYTVGQVVPKAVAAYQEATL